MSEGVRHQVLDRIRKAVEEKTTRWTDEAWILYPDEQEVLRGEGYAFAQTQDYGDDANTYYVRKR